MVCNSHNSIIWSQVSLSLYAELLVRFWLWATVSYIFHYCNIFCVAMPHPPGTNHVCQCLLAKWLSLHLASKPQTDARLQCYCNLDLFNCNKCLNLPVCIDIMLAWIKMWVYRYKYNNLKICWILAKTKLLFFVSFHITYNTVIGYALLLFS